MLAFFPRKNLVAHSSHRCLSLSLPLPFSPYLTFSHSRDRKRSSGKTRRSMASLVGRRPVPPPCYPLPCLFLPFSCFLPPPPILFSFCPPSSLMASRKIRGRMNPPVNLEALAAMESPRQPRGAGGHGRRPSLPTLALMKSVRSLVRRPLRLRKKVRLTKTLETP